MTMILSQGFEAQKPLFAFVILRANPQEDDLIPHSFRGEHIPQLGPIT